MAIDVSPELTAALHETTQVSRRLRAAVKSSDQEQHRRVWKECLLAQQRLREAWLAMATPVPITTRG